MATYDADFSDALSFGEDETSSESHLYSSDSFSFSDSYRVNEQHTGYSDSLNFADFPDGESAGSHETSDSIDFSEVLIGESAGTHSSSNTIAFTESYKRTVDVSRRSDTIAFFDFPFADPSGNDAETSQSITFSESYVATKTIASDRRILSEILTFIESRIAQKVRTAGEIIHFLESWCLIVDVRRTRTDAFSLFESRRRYVNDIHDPRNNPIVIPTGTGFSMKGNYRKRRSEVIHFEDRFTPVDASGVPLVLEACHYNVYHHVGWSELAGWSGLLDWSELDA